MTELEGAISIKSNDAGVMNYDAIIPPTKTDNPNPFDELKKIIKDTIGELLKDYSTRPPEALWDMQYTADYLGIKKQTLGLWNTKGKGPAPTKIGGRTVYRPEVVRMYVIEKTLPR